MRIGDSDASPDRGVGQTIRIGEDIAVTIVEVKGNQIRVGIAAPRAVAVKREVVCQRIVADRPTLPAKPR